MRRPTPTRRDYLLATVSLVAPACWGSQAPSPTSPQAQDTLAGIEARVGGRVGVFALNTGTGAQLGSRADERFAMCSTFKWLLAALVLTHVDRGTLTLDERLPYDSSHLLEYAPVTRQHVGEGSLSVGALAEASITLSDNTAANLLLDKLGGPTALTHYARSLGDPVTRLDRNEPTLNTNSPGDPRDTTSPRAMVGLMNRVLCGDALSPASRQRLLGWLRACQTGKRRLRAGLPQDWLIGNKTGSGERNAVNDVAIAEPPGRPPLLLAVYTSESSSSLERLERAHAEVAQLVAREI